jgi:N-acetylglutamate synthase-like GNAT family acetyltransferase
MSVRKTTNNDKQAVLEFCKNTFSWGDYIADVWDSWIDEGNFLIIHENNLPVAICHASLYKDGKQVWIEGIRVNEHFRRKGHASKLVKESEKIGKQNGCDTAYMLIASTNKKSLELARKLNYAIFETWYFYSLEPKKVDSIQNIKFASYKKNHPR